MKSKIPSASLLIFLFILIIIWILTGLGEEIYRKHQINNEIKDLETEINQLEEQNEALTSFINQLNSDKVLEKEARLKLNLAKEGEKLVIITPATNPNNETNQTETNSNLRGSSNFRTWLKYLFDINP